MTSCDKSKRSIVFGEYTMIDGYSLSRAEKHCHHWQRELKGAAIELFEDRCWQSIHSNEVQALIDDPSCRRVFGDGHQNEIKPYFQLKFPPRFLPNKSLIGVLWDAYRSHADSATRPDDHCKYEIFVNNRLIAVSRCGEPTRSDLRRHIIIRAFIGENDRNFVDYPIRSIESYRDIDWIRAFDDAHTYTASYLFNYGVKHAVTTKSEVMDIVFEEGVGAIALHEACGHLVESDLSILDSSSSIKVGEKVARSFITLVDNPTIPGALGSYSVDDEGKLAGVTTIVEHGRLRRLLCSMRYSNVDDKDASANGRRSSYRDRAYPRMSNLVLLPGKMSRSEIIKSVSRGILVKSIGVGGENYPGLSSFALSVKDGRFITNGKVGERTGRLIIRGTSADFLQGVTLVGRKPAYKPLATLCEKHQQRLYTDGIAPPFLVKDLSVLWGVNE